MECDLIEINEDYINYLILLFVGFDFNFDFLVVYLQNEVLENLKIMNN